jgi:hypothetical protein
MLNQPNLTSEPSKQIRSPVIHPEKKTRMTIKTPVAGEKTPRHKSLTKRQQTNDSDRYLAKIITLLT